MNRVKKTWIWVGGSIVLVLGMQAPCFFEYFEPHPGKFYEVIPGKIYRSEQPDSIYELANLKQARGLKTIINLRGEKIIQRDSSAQVEAEFARNYGVKLVFINFELPPSDQNVKDLLAVLDDERNHPVLIHCEEGVVRTGLAVAVYRMERCGWTPEQVLNEMLQQGFQNRLRPGSRTLRYFIFVATYTPKYPLTQGKN